MGAAIAIMLRDTSRLQAIRVMQQVLIDLAKRPHADAPPGMETDYEFVVAVVRYLVGSFEPFNEVSDNVRSLLYNALDEYKGKQPEAIHAEP